MFRRRNLVLVAFVFAVTAVALGQALASRNDMLRNLPESLDATRVSFLRSFANGFGPGANETGFAVIHLSDTGADRIADGGIPWLNAQPGGRLDPDWSATPVPHDETWMGREDSAMGAFPEPTVAAVLDRYGFGIEVPKKHLTAVDAALNTPGSFYAFGRGGLVAVVVPNTRRAYVFYAG